MKSLRTMTEKTAGRVLALATAVLLSLGAIPALTQSAYNLGGVFVAPFAASSRAQTVTAADTEPAMYIKYVGTASATTTVAVEANGDLTFVENGAAHDGFECPVSGALGGVIDVSDVACDTIGEVVDVINKDADGVFKAVIGAALRSDSSNASFLADAADTEVKDPRGEVVFWDSSNLDDVNLGLFDKNLGVRNWLPEGARKLPRNPFADHEQVLQYAHVKVTNLGTIGNYEVHCVVENYVDGSTSTETDTVLYLEPGAASTVVGLVNEFINAGGLRCQGGKILFRALASGADTTAFEAFVTGYSVPIKR